MSSRLEILSYLQANKLACHSFMVADKRHETSESKIEDFIPCGMSRY